jgi:hypothetical protein
MVIFGGTDTTGAIPDPLWSLSLGGSVAWTELGGRPAPGRWNAATAIDPTRRIMWIHGGQGWESGMLTRADLRSFALAALTGWNQPTTTGTPLGKRFGHSAVYDALRDRLLFFGGNDSTADQNDVRALTLSGTPAWSQLSPSGTPPAVRSGHSAVYDAVNDRMVVFGGTGGSGTMNDVWALSLSGTPAWSQLSPSGTPPPTLWGQSAALDDDANRLIIFGGNDGSLQNKVYALSLTGSPAWAELLPSGTPPAARQQASMVSLGTHMLVFGGDVTGMGGGATNDAWLLSLYPTPSWRQLEVGPTLPPGRWSHAAVLDRTTFEMIVFGGSGLYSDGSDAWRLQLNEAVPTLASLVSSNAMPGRVELAWEISSSDGAVTVYRRAGDGPWTELDRLTPDGTGRIAFVDLDVIAGARYGYRLGIPEGGGEVFAGEVWVDVPEVARFALRGMTPNPAPTGAGLIRFSLADASPARLELMDVSGRQVFSREVGNLGPGEHVVRASGARSLVPGIYLVRLTQGGHTLTAKAATIR